MCHNPTQTSEKNSQAEEPATPAEDRIPNERDEIDTTTPAHIERAREANRGCD